MNCRMIHSACRTDIWLDDRMGMIGCLMIFRSMGVEVLEGLDVWMVEWLNGCMSGRLDVWMVGWLNSCMFGWLED